MPRNDGKAVLFISFVFHRPGIIQVFPADAADHADKNKICGIFLNLRDISLTALRLLRASQ
ncbi:hypothetical protein DU508_15265 [Pedobacter chinensis]|uniref:Uncharacterized protein n=1 Tax=Pedobacter chinensis TaxID=2282421 RepID=A0A369PWS1_9SPHI|nr:hypothetical protein DU508_15265 [Pedobacter chinensis]